MTNPLEEMCEQIKKQFVFVSSFMNFINICCITLKIKNLQIIANKSFLDSKTQWDSPIVLFREY